MKLCIATSFDDNYAEIGDICAATIRKYAEKFGYDYRVFREPMSDRPPTWDKVIITQQLFEEGYEYVLWSDADALFTNFDHDILAEVEPDKFLYITILIQTYIEMPGVRVEVDFPSFGFFLIKNTAWSKSLLKQIWSRTRYIKTAPSDNAAFLEVLGYTHYLYRLASYMPEHKKAKHPVKNTFPYEIWKHIKVLDSKWNSIEGIPYVPNIPNPIMKHYPAQDYKQRLFSMQQDYNLYVLQKPIIPVDHITYAFDQPFYGDGWQVAEFEASGVPFRWTGKPVATLQFPLKSDHDYSISFDLCHVLTVETWQMFQLRVNDVRIAIEKTATASGYSCQGVIPKNLIQAGKLTTLQFCVQQTRTPTEFAKVVDGRQLGIAVSRLEITAANTSTIRS